MFSCQFCISDDRVHGCADIMGHIKQKGRFCPIGSFRRLCCLFQFLLLDPVFFFLLLISKIPADHRKNCHQYGKGCDSYGWLIGFFQETIRWFHIDFHTERTNDITWSSIGPYWITGCKNVSPGRIYDLLRINRFPGKGTFNIGDHLFFNISSRISKIICSQIQTIDQIDQLPVCPSFGCIQVSGWI